MQSLPFKILIIALAVTLLTPFSAFAQNAVAEKVFLKSGKSYTGEIVLRNDEVLILKLSDGTRFQFAAQDIEKIETVYGTYVYEGVPNGATFALGKSFE